MLKKTISFFLILCLMLAALTGVCAEGTSADIVEIQKYGNLVLSMSGSAFLDQGFAYGDIVTVAINGQELEMPVGSNYSDVEQGSMICRVVVKPDANEDYMILAINMGDLATTTGIATKEKTEAEHEDTEKTRLILNNMDDRVRDKIVGGVLAVKAQKESARAILEKVFPDFTPTQISIAQLILQDKKLTEICRTLGKTENNISAQRSKIRSTLGIESEVSLKEALQERLDAYLQSQET